MPQLFTQENIEIEGIWIGKYLCKKSMDGINENIHITSPEDNPQIWTGLNDTQKQEKISQMTTQNNTYGLTQDTTIKIVDNTIYDSIEKLKISAYSFISDKIQENETDYPGSFRIYMYLIWKGVKKDEKIRTWSN